MRTILLKFTAFFVLALFISSCDDWTETESLHINEADVKKDNPELYKEYLENLRKYRNLNHMLTYVWFDNNNVKTPASRGEHINVVPDSVDVISLLHPDNLNERELKEIDEVRERGTKVIYTISFSNIEALYKAKVDSEPAPEKGSESGEDEGEGEEPEPEVDGFLAFCAEYMDYNLSLVSKFNYDGLAVYYEGKLPNHMQEEEKAIYFARQEAFMSKVRAWVVDKGDKMFVFEGKPQNLVDKSVLEQTSYIVLREFAATSGDAFDFAMRMAGVDGVPTDRYILAVSAIPLDPNDKNTGRFVDSSNKPTIPAITGAADWIASYYGKPRLGLGIYNVQYDFYNTKQIYQYTREAISTMNPAPKN